MSALALERRHRFGVDDWLKMGEAGVFPPDYRGELIEGEVVDMAPIGPTHGGCVKWLNNFFAARLAGRCIVSAQDPIKLGDLSSPQPDIVLLRPASDYYRNGHPIPEDILLLVEVAESSLRYDREVKAPLYARFGIPEYWLVNLTEQCLEVYRQPEANGCYQSVARYERSDTIAPLAWPEVVVSIRELLG